MQRTRAGHSLSGECSASLRSEVLKLFWLHWKQCFSDSRPYLHFSMTDYIRSPLVTNITRAFFSSLVVPANAILAWCSEAWAFAFHFNMHIPLDGWSPTLLRTTFQSLPTQATFPKPVSPPHLARASRAACWDPPSSGSWNLQVNNHISLNTWKNKYFFLQLFVMKLRTPGHTCASQMYPCVHTQNTSIKRVSYKTCFGNFTLSAINIMAWAAEFSLGWYVLKQIVNLNHEEALMLPFVLNSWCWFISC